MGYVFGLRDVKLAPLNSDGVTWGANVDVLSVIMYGVTFNLETGELEGDDIITDSHSKPQAANVELEFGFNNLAVWTALTGKAGDSYTNYTMWGLGRDNMQYFGINGRIDATSGAGDLQIFLPRVKIMSDIPFSARKGQYVIPRVTARAHFFNDLWGIGKLIVNDTATSVTIPPTFASS